MKELIKKFTTKEQRYQLFLSYQSTVKKIGAFFGFFLNLFPVRFRIFLITHLRILKPLDYPKEKILIDVCSVTELVMRTRSCYKEPETVQWIESFNKGDVLWDIGANIGAYSLIAAKYHHGAVPVYAIEPSFLNFSQLCKNIGINHCDNIITPFNVALSEKTQIGKFNYQNLDVGGAWHAFGNPIDFKNQAFDPVLKQNIMSFKLDDLLTIFSLPQPTHVKLDVDGIELKIIQGGSQVLSRAKTILVEVEDSDVQLFDALTQLGFKLDKKFPMRRLKNFANYIFTRRVENARLSKQLV